MNTREIHKMYDQTNKDMPRHEFVKQVQDLTDPVKAQQDVMQIMGMKQTAAARKHKIDGAVQNAR